MNLYEIIYPIFKWPKEKTIKVFETFAGVGAQAKALENLNVNHKIIGISEIDKDAIVSYAAIHCRLNEQMIEFHFPEKEVMIKYLQNLDVGYDFNNEKHTITDKTSIDKVKRYYLASKLSNNMGNISHIHASDMPETDLLTYSFPCQDLSRAGRMKGMDKGANTRSGLLWEVERLLDEGCLINKLPRILVMENVPEVIGTRNKKNFMLWFSKLESLGYQSYYKILDAQSFGIPQHRERCFMISILGKYSYIFPKGKKLNIKLIDVMEQTANISDFLTQKVVDRMMGIDILDDRFLSFDYKISKNPNSFPSLYCINQPDLLGQRVPQTDRIFDNRGIAATITCGYTGFYLVDKSQYPKDENADAIGKIDEKYVRKLTVTEAFRLMGFEDEDVEKMKKAGVSNHQLYRQAGNSIVVNVLEALFKQLFS